MTARHWLSRSQLPRFFGQRPAATVLLEACGSAHFWSREVERLGHQGVLWPPQHVRRYRPCNKTDRADVAFWRYLEFDELPQGAKLKTA